MFTNGLLQRPSSEREEEIESEASYFCPPHPGRDILPRLYVLPYIDPEVLGPEEATTRS